MESIPKHVPTYYEKIGACAHDYILRCEDCKSLVRHSSLVKRGACTRCGNRRVSEVRSLTLWEWLLIRLAVINFPHRKLFLAEFSPKGWWNRG